MGKDVKAVARYQKTISVPVLEETFEAIENYLQAEATIYKRASGLVVAGYQLAWRPNDRAEGYSAAITGYLASNQNAGIQFFANGPTPTEALAVLLGKVDILGTDVPWLENPDVLSEKRYS